MQSKSTDPAFWHVGFLFFFSAKRPWRRYTTSYSPCGAGRGIDRFVGAVREPPGKIFPRREAMERSTYLLLASTTSCSARLARSDGLNLPATFRRTMAPVLDSR